ncbi:DUF3530 family protein [uncultured Cocleimonas sp.]|uniref:DUF3530 family protein n=1 Tax=uncultured Cocleimonas sp. TaxID=1051587 RepID=UPI00261AEE3D|nr:DUF3530 family protein [uncultured Cocleimonas sp.]
MNKNLIKALFISMLLALSSVSVNAFAKAVVAKADLEREKRMAIEVEDAVLDGEVIFLEDTANEGHAFMAIDMEAESDKSDKGQKGAVLILHGRGFHPNWEDAIYPLRTQLPASGWRTLSLQMPVLEKSAKYYDYVPLFPQAAERIDMGITYLKKQGVKKIVILAHSCGAHMAMDWVRNQKGLLDESVIGYIGAGMGATDYKQKMAEPFPLAEMKVPVLDIYGDKDYPAVLRMAEGRLTDIKMAGDPKSAQVIVPGADHYFKGKGNEVTAAVATWLNSL